MVWDLVLGCPGLLKGSVKRFLRGLYKEGLRFREGSRRGL